MRQEKNGNNSEQTMHLATSEILLRLLVALVLSGAVGLQRSITGKVAGMRTHVLVGVGAAIFTLVSAEAFASGSPDRIAAQIVTGVGFIAGGVILKERGAVHGLTTAAGLWAVASLGMAAGAGLYVLSVAGAAAVLMTFIVLRYVELGLPRRRLKTWELRITLRADRGPAALESTLAAQLPYHQLQELRRTDTTCVVYKVRLPHDRDPDALTQALLDAGASTITWATDGDLEA
jgi:putative Mg2+ transporter-C (MgtC) family protein